MRDMHIEENGIERNCPICGHAVSHKVFSRDFSGMGSIVPFSRYDVVECTKCGGYYADHLVESMELARYYEELSKYEDVEFALSEASRRDHEMAVHFLEGHLTSETSVLDIGCGNGALLRMLQERGLLYLTGLEPSAKNCAAIESAWGIRAVVGVLGGEIPALANQQFDIVVMKGVLEHLLHVKENVAQALPCLAEDGQLYIIVPAVEAFPRCADLYQQFSVEHVNFFSLRSLENLMHSFGMVCTSHAIHGEALFSLWRRGEGTLVRRDSEGIRLMREYLTLAEGIASRIAEVLLPFKGKKVYLWGAGTHTAILFQLGLLDMIDVEAIIDSNANYCGKRIFGVPVLSPEELRVYPEHPVVISSQGAQDAIHRQMKEVMQLPNEAVKLY